MPAPTQHPYGEPLPPSDAPPPGWSALPPLPGHSAVPPPLRWGSPVTTPPAGRRLPAVERRPLLVAALAGLIGVVAGAGAVRAGDHTTHTTAAAGSPVSIQQVSAPSGGSLDAQPKSVASIAKRVLPSVVTVQEKQISGGSGLGLGSGVVLSTTGYILTNNHVVAEVADSPTSWKLSVVRNGETDASAMSATIVGTDPVTDLAVIKVDSGTWVPAVLGHSAGLAVGDPVIAVGAPLGLSGTVTAGIVSTVDRFVDIPASGNDPAVVYDRAIQTDAAINPGNSGGALVDSTGAVVGINSAIATAGGGGAGTQGGSIGVGFAIPIDEAQPVAQDLISTGKATHSFLGVLTTDHTDPVGAAISSMSDPTSGRKVSGITAGSPADKAGLQEGDVITGVDGMPVTGQDSLLQQVRKVRVGQSVPLTYVRDRKSSTVQVTLTDRPTP